MRLLSILSNSKAYELLRTLQRDKSASTGLWLLIVFSVIVLFAPIIAPYGPNEAIPSLRLAPPGTPGYSPGPTAASDGCQNTHQRLRIGFLPHQ